MKKLILLLALCMVGCGSDNPPTQAAIPAKGRFVSDDPAVDSHILTDTKTGCEYVIVNIGLRSPAMALMPNTCNVMAGTERFNDGSGK